MHDTSRLQMRLRSCLRSILDLEDELRDLDKADPLLAEFAILKDVFGRLDTLLVREDDVQRIEAATASFFEELNGLVRQDAYMHCGQRFLQ